MAGPEAHARLWGVPSKSPRGTSVDQLWQAYFNGLNDRRDITHETGFDHSSKISWRPWFIA
jgi:hypothetical protein